MSWFARMEAGDHRSAVGGCGYWARAGRSGCPPSPRWCCSGTLRPLVSLAQRVSGIPAAFSAAWAGWLVVATVLAMEGVFRQDPSTVGLWLAAAFTGGVAALLLTTLIPVVARSLAAPGSAGRLALPQTVRVVGVSFLIMMVVGQLPAVFAVPAGLGDIAVGLAAPAVARQLARGGPRAHRRGMVFNILGIVDLLVAVGIGFLAGLSPHPAFTVTPSTQALGLFPLVLIPVTAVPLAFALHVTSLRQLRAVSRSTRDRSPFAVTTPV